MCPPRLGLAHVTGPIHLTLPFFLSFHQSLCPFHHPSIFSLSQQRNCIRFTFIFFFTLHPLTLGCTLYLYSLASREALGTLLAVFQL